MQVNVDYSIKEDTLGKSVLYAGLFVFFADFSVFLCTLHLQLIGFGFVCLCAFISADNT